MQTCNPLPQIRTIERLPAQTKNRRHIFQLPLGLGKFRPLQFREDKVFGACNKHRNALDIYPSSTTEFFQAESACLADNQIELPARSQVDDVKQGFCSLSF